MAEYRKQHFSIFFLIVLFATFSSCGGAESEGSASGSLPTKILSWNPPTQYTDGSPLGSTELDRFEIYINTDGLFPESENETASVSATDPGTGKPVTSFDLSKLSPYLFQGITYHVSIRAVALSGLKSDFSPSATFSF